MKVADHFKLIKDHPASFEIHDQRDGRSFHVAKRGLSESMYGSMKKMQPFAKGEKVQRFSEGGTSGAPINSNDPGTRDDPHPIQAIQDALAAGGSQDAYEQSMASLPQTPADQDSPPAAGVQLASNGSVTPDQVAEISPHNTPESSDQSDGDAVLQAGALANNAPLIKERTAIEAGSQAEQNAARSTSNMMAITGVQRDIGMDEISEMMKAGQKRSQELQDAYADKTIDPNHYWNNKSTGSKILSGLGMVLGGMGSGTTGGPNMAMETINRAIERDMDAQKNDQSQAMNLWKMNREATQSDIAAKVDFMNQAMIGVKAKAVQYATQAGGPMAAARAAPFISDLTQRINQGILHSQLLKASGTGATLNVDPAMMLNMIPDPKLRDEAGKEISAQKTLSNTRAQVFDTFNQLKNINTVGNFATSPIQTQKQVAALRDNAATNLARDEAGRVNEFEFKAAQDAFPAKGDNDATLAQKAQNLQGIINRKRNPGTSFKSGTGIDLDRFKTTALGNSMQQAAPKSQTMGGIQYVKVPGGWKRTS